VLSARDVDEVARTIVGMDVLAIALGILMFGVLLALIWGIDRI
jgi:hypothetical protein